MPRFIPEFPPRATEIRSAVANGTLSARDGALATIAAIERLDPDIHAWQVFDPAALLAQAERLDARLAAGGTPGLLAGVPLAVKDILDTEDLPTGYGSAVYHGHRPARDAVAVAAARAAGALVAGKTVTTEFAYFAPGPTANPWNLAHTPGGSSSGSAAAVASGMVPLAFGTQTAGSLIRPASYCGVFAIKPGFGQFSTEGAKPFAPSLDTLGWLANTADDLELMRCALSGTAYVELPAIATARLRLARCPTFEASAMDATGLQAWDEAERRLALAQVASTTASMPVHLNGLLQAQKTVMAYEAARHLDRDVRAHAPRLGAAILELVRTGQAVSTAGYDAARTLIERGRHDVEAMMADIGPWMVPAAPGEAPLGLAATGDPVFSRVWTALGLPCVSVPGLLGPNGLPVGMQLVGRRGDERELLAIARSLHPVLAAHA